MALLGVPVGLGTSVDPGTATINGDAAVSVGLNASGINFSLKSASVTLAGSTYNGANHLMMFDSNGKYPAADGSAITNVMGGQGAALNSTNTWSAAQTFASSITIRSVGREIILSTSTTSNNIDIDQNGNISLQGGLVSIPAGTPFQANGTLTTPSGSIVAIQGGANFMVKVGTFDFNAGAATATISNLSAYLLSGETSVSSITWMVHYECVISSASQIFAASFNNDIGAHYNYVGYYMSNASVHPEGGTADKAIDLNPTNSGSNNTSFSGDISFHSAYRQTSAIIEFDYHGGFYVLSGSYGPVVGHGLWTGSAALNQINFTSNSAGSGSAPDHAGVPRCYMELWRNPWQHQ
jgi:hypothetical protein